MGKKGFKRPQDMTRIYKINTLNVKDLDFKLNNYVENGLAEKSGDTYSINLSQMDVQKLLGKGEIRKKVNISVKTASEKAIEKVKAAGGKVVLIESQ